MIVCSTDSLVNAQCASCCASRTVLGTGALVDRAHAWCERAVEILPRDPQSAPDVARAQLVFAGGLVVGNAGVVITILRVWLALEGADDR